MSTTEMNAEFGVTQAPGSSARLPTNPLTGEVMMVFDEVDLQLVEPRLRLRVLRLRQVELRRRGLIARVGVVEGLLRNQLALEQVRERSRLVCASLRSASRWRIVAAETSNDASACLTCSRSSRSSTLASRCPRVTRSPSRTETVSSRPLTLGTASTVAAPIRLPTTVDAAATCRRA